MGSLSRPIGEGRAESGEACPGPDPGSGPLRVAIGVKRQADTAPDTAGIRGKGRLSFLYPIFDRAGSARLTGRLYRARRGHPPQRRATQFPTPRRANVLRVRGRIADARR